jgi:hypothetical protein
LRRFFDVFTLSSVDFDAGAANALAGEVVLLGLDEDNLAIDSGMNREVTAHEGAWACELSCAGLANENFTGLYGLATKALDAEALASIVVDVFTGTTSFDM